MTPTLKEQLEQWIDREAITRETYEEELSFREGAHSILPMLLVALDALEVYSSNKSFTIDGHKNVVVFSGLETYWPEHFSKEALSNIKQMIEVK